MILCSLYFNILLTSFFFNVCLFFFFFNKNNLLISKDYCVLRNYRFPIHKNLLPLLFYADQIHLQFKYFIFFFSHFFLTWLKNVKKKKRQLHTLQNLLKRYRILSITICLFIHMKGTGPGNRIKELVLIFRKLAN